jgi:hypothetical protein
MDGFSVRRLVASSYFAFNLILVGIAPPLIAQDATKVRVVGTVTSVDPQQVQIRTDAGAVVTAKPAATTRILRAVPGQKDLASAPAITLQDVHNGDRMLVSGISKDGGKSVDALTLVVMSSGDLAQRRTQEQQAWQNGKRGVVTLVDAASHKVTVKSATGSTEIVLAPSASVMRYREGSSKFADAQPATIDQIHIGDQLQARGASDASGAFTADAVVFGTFANIAGRITAVDAENGSVTVSDVFTKKSVTLHVNAQSQLRQLPQMIAQRIAMAQRRAADADAPPATAVGATSNRPFDFQQVIARSPSIAIADLHKGDAIIAVAGSEAANSPAFYIVDGVEPILTAAPGGSAAAALLASWNLSGSGGEGE